MSSTILLTTMAAVCKATAAGLRLSFCLHRWVLLVSLCLAAASAHPAEIRMAAASNFVSTLHRLVTEYTRTQPGFSARISAGASGKHFAQIRQGAPFDVFFCADDQLTRALAHSGHAVAESRFVYAQGQLVLWSKDPARIEGDGLALLRTGSFGRLAIANPRVAPYGAAAKGLLQQARLKLQPGQLVTGQSLGQALNFVTTGNASLGLLAASQVIAYEREHGPGSRWTPESSSYPQIVQEAVRLTGTDRPQGAQAFLDWVRYDTRAHAVIEADGYALP